MPERALKEISREKFWKLQEKWDSEEMTKACKGKLTNIGNRKYVNSWGTWFSETDGVYFCHHSIEHLAR